MRLAAALGVLVLAAGVLAPSPRAAGGQAGEGWDVPRVPAIESLAPGAFDPHVAARAEAYVTYRVDATVRVPLLFGSIPIADRAGVGVASFRVRDLAVPGGGTTDTLRAYEFFAASDPARARGLNRLGFIREAAWIVDRVPRRTVQFGVISTDRAASRAEAERGLDGGDPTRAQSVSVIDSVITPGVTRSEVVRLSVGGLWQRADDLYAAVRPRWGAEQPDDAGTVANDPPRYPARSASWAPCRPACARPRKPLPSARRRPTDATATCTTTSSTFSPVAGAGSTPSEAAATGERA